MARPAVATASIDRLIAQSKRVTEDLNLLRHELRDIASTPSRREIAADRAYIAYRGTESLAQDLLKLWQENNSLSKRDPLEAR